jgi:hypothetical protein
MNISFLPEAQEELHASLAWYEKQKAGLGQRFLESVSSGLGFIRNNSQVHAFFYKEYRRVLLKQFPFALVYRIVSDDEIVVVAVAHMKRKPGYWKKR